MSVPTTKQAEREKREEKERGKQEKKAPSGQKRGLLSVLTRVEGLNLPLSYVTDRPLPEHVRNVRGMEVRGEDVVLLAYAKSGTHWLWEVLTMLRSGRAEHESRSKVFAMLEATPVETIQAQPSPRVLNSHLPLRLLPRGIQDKKVKVVQVYRNVKDVMVSLFFHFQPRVGKEFTLGELEELFLSDEAPTGNYFTYMKEMYDFRHNSPDHPVCLLSFEDIKEDPEREIRKLAEFLGVRACGRLCGDIVRATSFGRLKEASRNKQYPANIPQGLINVFRKGEVGDWKNYLTVAQSERLDAAMTQLKSCDYHFRYEL